MKPVGHSRPLCSLPIRRANLSTTSSVPNQKVSRFFAALRAPALRAPIFIGSIIAYRLQMTVCYVAGLQVYPHPDSCNHYYKCANGSLTLETCGNGLLFNEATALRGTATSSSLLFTARYATPPIIFPALTLQRKSHLCVLGIARPQSQFSQSSVCERFAYSQDLSTYFLQRRQTRECGNWDLWPQFFFWEFSVFFLCSVG